MTGAGFCTYTHSSNFIVVSRQYDFSYLDQIGEICSSGPTLPYHKGYVCYECYVCYACYACHVVYVVVYSNCMAGGFGRGGGSLFKGLTSFAAAWGHSRE